MCCRKFIRDTTDRNRTSPFAFTGNKFEFRMLGLFQQHCVRQHHAQHRRGGIAAGSMPTMLEKADDFETALHDMIRETIRDAQAHHLQRQRLRRRLDRGGHRRARPAEPAHHAGRAADAAGEEERRTCSPRYKVIRRTELHSRYEIMLDNYCKTVNIEALTMVDMARREILPGCRSLRRRAGVRALPRSSSGRAGVFPARYEKGVDPNAFCAGGRDRHCDRRARIGADQSTRPLPT